MSFKKTPKQVEATNLLSSSAIEIMLYGGSRSGKTAILIRSILIRAIKEKSKHLIIRRYFRDVKRSIWLDTLPKIIQLCFPDLIEHFEKNKNNSDFFYKLPNKSEFWIGGLDDNIRAEKVLGNEYSTILFNECSQISLSSINTAKTRLAEKNKLVNKIYYDMNPPAKSHWSYLQFILKKNPEDKLPLKNPDRFASLIMNPKDNLENLDQNYMSILDDLPISKRKRFRDGEFTEDVQGEIFNLSDIQRVDKLPELDRIVIGYDPAVTSRITSDEHGIIICGKRGDYGFVINDLSGIFSPKNSARVVVNGFHDYNCDRIIGEVNQGGDYIETVLRQIDPNISYKSVRAIRNKCKRAEPVGALYEQKKIFHYGHFPELENEMGEFKTNEKEMEYSPNRVDALVWAMHELFNLSQGEPRIRQL